jgi:hypothetical protein
VAATTRLTTIIVAFWTIRRIAGIEVMSNCNRRARRVLQTRAPLLNSNGLSTRPRDSGDPVKKSKWSGSGFLRARERAKRVASPFG